MYIVQQVQQQQIQTHRKMRKLRVLVDMDGVLCDFEGHMLSLFQKKFSDEPFVKPEDRNTIFMHKQFEQLKPGLGSKIQSIMYEQDFFLTMPEIEDAVKSVKEMSDIPGVEVFICTSPVNDSKYCAPEKYEWIEKHFGSSWIRRTILTSDKTLINGDLLIDDIHFIEGTVDETSWDHILFTQCHNRHLDEKHFQEKKIARRLDNWKDDSWRHLIDQYMKKHHISTSSH